MAFEWPWQKNDATGQYHAVESGPKLVLGGIWAFPEGREFTNTWARNVGEGVGGAASNVVGGATEGVVGNKTTLIVLAAAVVLGAVVLLR